MKINVYKIILISIFLIGCRETKEIQREEKIPPSTSAIKVPDFKFKIASIQLSTHTTKYSLKSIDEIVTKLKNENIDILAIKSATRYPELSNRIDLLGEVKKKTDMKYKFFEIENNSGRQLVDAIFSIYPFIAGDNSFLKFIPTGSIIDIGVTNLYVSIISSDKNLNDLTNRLNSGYQIFVGDFRNDILQKVDNDQFNKYLDTFLIKKHDELKVINHYTVQIQLGKIMICELGIYQNFRK